MIFNRFSNHIGQICAPWLVFFPVVDGAEVDPAPPEDDDAEYEKWIKPERVALGLMIGTTTNLHFELYHAYYRGGTVAETVARSRTLTLPYLWYHLWFTVVLVGWPGCSGQASRITIEK